MMLVIPCMINAQTSNNNIKNTKNKEINMNTTQQNKEVVRKIFEQCLNKRNLDQLKEFISDDYIGLLGKKGAAGFQEPALPLIKAFPDIQWNITELVAEGDKVVLCWKWQGTQTAAYYANVASTGKTITNDGVAILTLKNGKVISNQVLTDRLGFLQAMNILPADVNALVNKKAHNGQVNFIDKFFVPKAAINEFQERVKINRDFIKTLPGFIEDAAYEYTDNEGNLICVTVALWQSQEALNKAKEAVQEFYKKDGFNPSEMLQRLQITADRGIYTQIHE
jgi:predicted ester cyclase/heme-degrading monooxygenase HmoA